VLDVNIEALNSTPGWLTEKQLAEHLQISTRHLINLRKAGLPDLSSKKWSGLF
jgi:hypothetical protein